MNFFKEKKNIFIAASYVLLAAVFFLAGFAVGGIGGGEETEARTASVTTEEYDEVQATFFARTPYYEVIIEDSVLKINKCIGDDKILVTEEEISENVFPPDDMAELRDGIKFERLEQAQQMFENFVS